MNRVYSCKDGRERIYIKETKKVMSYPKYLMEEYLGRELEPDEQVHHKDENPLNNDISNLEVRKLGEHQREHAVKYSDDIKTCPWCGKEFIWSALRQRRAAGNKSPAGPFCSRSCAGHYGKSVQLSKRAGVM